MQKTNSCCEEEEIEVKSGYWISLKINNCFGGSKPKEIRDDVLSLIKSGHLDILNLLIDKRTNLNFIEEPTELNPFCQPVLRSNEVDKPTTVGMIKAR